MFHKIFSVSGYSARMATCMKIDSISAVTAISFCRNLRRSPTRKYSRFAPVKRALLSECLLCTEAAFRTGLIIVLRFMFNGVVWEIPKF